MERRTFLKMGALGAAAVVSACSGEPAPWNPSPFGPLVENPGGLLDLPRGFRYRILIEDGVSMADGSPSPGRPDGMAAFAGSGEATILVRNHELEESQGPPVAPGGASEGVSPGGTTGLVITRDRRLADSYVTSSGSARNCAGGRTPWNTWLTCEETTVGGHGYVFEVTPSDPESNLAAQPITEMGRFSHEAVGIDPTTRICYLTEDEGPESFLFRYTPDDRRARPGALHDGGSLEALILETPDSGDPEDLEPGATARVRWAPVTADAAHDDAYDDDAARFRRLEGASFSNDSLWFNDTTGGQERQGRIYRYTPVGEILRVVAESSSRGDFKAPDNITFAPWGDLVFVEDGTSGNRIIGLTQRGSVYTIGLNRLNDSELAGPCFSPDGRTMFVNIQTPGITIAIWGPFERLRRTAGRMATDLDPHLACSLRLARDAKLVVSGKESVWDPLRRTTRGL